MTEARPIGSRNGLVPVVDQPGVVVGHGRIAVTERGGGSPVLFLHGIGSSSASFEHQLAALADDHRCIAWDAPGYGDSDDPPAAPTMDGYAEAAAELLVELGARPAHVVGTSWGGVVAVRLALRHPDTVRSLVLADSTRGAGTSPEQAAAMRRRGDELERLGAQEFARARAPRLLSPDASADLVADVTRTMVRAIRNPGYRWATEAMAETDHLPLLAALRVPALVVVGEHDTVTTVHASRELAGALPCARFEMIDGAGHLAHQERAARFNELLRGFLAEVERSPNTDAPPCVQGGATAP